MTEFFERILSIWIAGGWTMAPLCLLSIFIPFLALKLFWHFAKRDFRRIPKSTWGRWVMDPSRGRGKIGEIIRYTQDNVKSLEEIQNRFAEVAASEIPRIDRDIAFTNVLVTAVPLLGLLGTVTGMLLTFQSIGAGSGEMAEMMAKGISAALFPPAVGLCIALPSLAMVQMLKRKRDEYHAFLAHLETRTVQKFKKPGNAFGDTAGDPVTDFQPQELSGLELSPVAG